MDKKEKKIMSLTIGAHSLVHLFEGVLPPLIPLLVTEFGTDYFHLGLVVTVFSYAFGLGAVPAGILADKFGPRRLISIYLFAAGLIATLIWPVSTLWMYAIIMGLIGMFCSIYHPASNTLISLAIIKKGSAFGIHGIAGGLGVAGVPFLSAWLGSLFGWRTPHVFYGIIAILFGVYSLGIPEYHAPITGRSDVQTPNAGIDRKAFFTIIIFFMASTALGMSYKGIMTFLPVYMGTRVDLSIINLNTVTLGGTITTLALASGAVGQYLAGRLVDHHSAEKLYLGTVITGTICVFVMSASTNAWLVASTVIYAFFYFATQPIQNYLISRYLPEQRHGLGYGIHFFLYFGIGSTAAAVSGYIADRAGLESVFIFMGICFLISACMIGLLVFMTGNRRQFQENKSDAFR